MLLNKVMSVPACLYNCLQIKPAIRLPLTPNDKTINDVLTSTSNKLERLATINITKSILSMLE